MINVTQKNEREFIIEWDPEDPQESIFNTFTEQDFIEVLKYQAQRQLNYLKNSGSTEKKYGETYYNSESEGKDYKLSEEDIIKAAFISPEEYGTWDIYHQDNNEAL